MPWARRETLNLVAETFLNSPFSWISAMLFCHFSVPPQPARSQKCSSISMKKSVLRYPFSTSSSDRKCAMSFSSTWCVD